MMFCGSSPKRKHRSHPVSPPSPPKCQTGLDRHHDDWPPTSQDLIYESMSSLNAIVRSSLDLPQKDVKMTPRSHVNILPPLPVELESGTDTDILSRDDWPTQVPRPNGEF